ncbi:MAG: hypothetical protein ACREDE_08990 [Thermoplasmata archaeon]
MTAEGDRRLALIFGLLGAALLIAAGAVRLLAGIALLATGYHFYGRGAFDDALIFLVVGVVIGFFALLGRRRGADRSLAIGVLLVVLSIVGWLALGFASSVFAILAAVFTLISGTLFLIAGR